ncbi:cartilage matrix protein-like [Gigantopelta aegis]|uniref:cartilage matrix protein-like n=1 Tax=Gigantopelta aegis TaxID=1735272 RepID=UPI001B8887E2|nr:cartilage matrix protein-like [Gigantopelta aegis]
MPRTSCPRARSLTTSLAIVLAVRVTRLESAHRKHLAFVCAEPRAGQMSFVLQPAFGRPSTLTCVGRPADIVFVLDTSTSIWPLDFNNYVRPFISNVVAMLDVGSGATQTRVGVLTYSDDVNYHFQLKDHMTGKSLAGAIGDIPYIHGNTNTHRALRYMSDTMFTRENGARPYAARIAIVITDGLSNDPWSTQKSAEFARSMGIQIFAIGVGPEADIDGELSDIGNDPHWKFTFHVDNVQALATIERSLARRTCIETTPRPATTTSTASSEIGPIKDEPVGALKYCGGKPADIYFLLDSSNSIWIHDFNLRMVKFVRDMVNIFDIGTNKTRVGVITFSSDVTPVFRLDEYTSRDSLLKAISPEHIKHQGGGTNTGSAIAYVRDHGFRSRPQVAHIMVVITDGVSFDPEVTRREAAAAKRAGIYMFAVGVGQSVDATELRDMASSPSDRFMFSVSGFHALTTLRDILAIRTCTVPPPAEQAVCLPTDLVFIFETSSKTPDQRKHLRDVITTYAKTLRGSNVRVGAITDPCVEISFADLQSFKAQLNGIVDDSEILISGMLRKLRYSHFASSASKTKRVAVLVVDEKTRDFSHLIAQAKMAKAQGLKLFVVAVGNVWDRLPQEVASSPLQKHIVKVRSYEDLSANEFDSLTEHYTCRRRQS